MAACKAVSDMESLQHLITCGICLDTLHKPVLFPCIHHFCKECKSQLQQEVQDRIAGVRCPKCRRFTSHDSIKDDFVMEQIVDLHTSKDSEDLTGNDCCELCLKEKSEVKCLECKMKMCGNCRAIHLRQPFSRGHTLKDLHELKDVKMIDAVVFCSEHSDKLIEFSCVKCEKAICYKCKVLHHDGHKTETVEDAVSRLMSNVHKQLEPVDSEINNLQQKITLLEDTDQLTSRWENDTISQINNHKLQLIRKIEKDSEVLIQEVRTTAAATKKEIYIQKTDAEHLLSSKESTRSWVNTVVSHLGDVNLLQQLQGTVMATLNHQQIKQGWKLISAPAETFSKCNIGVDKNYVGNLEKVHSNQRGNLEKITSNQRGNLEKIPSYQRDNMEKRPSNQRGNMEKIPSNQRGNMEKIPSNQRGNMEKIPSNQRRSMHRILSNHRAPKQLGPSQTRKGKKIPLSNAGISCEVCGTWSNAKQIDCIQCGNFLKASDQVEQMMGEMEIHEQEHGTCQHCGAWVDATHPNCFVCGNNWKGPVMRSPNHTNNICLACGELASDINQTFCYQCHNLSVTIYSQTF